MLVARFEESHPIDTDLRQAVLLRDVAAIKDGLEERLSEWRTQFLVPMILSLTVGLLIGITASLILTPRLLRHNRESQSPCLAPRARTAILTAVSGCLLRI